MHLFIKKGDVYKRQAPEGVGVVNPAFDVTDHSLVTGIITEKGDVYKRQVYN